VVCWSCLVPRSLNRLLHWSPAPPGPTEALKTHDCEREQVCHIIGLRGRGQDLFRRQTQGASRPREKRHGPNISELHPHVFIQHDCLSVASCQLHYFRKLV